MTLVTKVSQILTKGDGGVKGWRVGWDGVGWGESQDSAHAPQLYHWNLHALVAVL